MDHIFMSQENRFGFSDNALKGSLHSKIKYECFYAIFLPQNRIFFFFADFLIYSNSLHWPKAVKLQQEQTSYSPRSLQCKEKKSKQISKVVSK